MKRFVDIRAAQTGWRFAWYCTVRSEFEVHSGQQAWDTFAEFASMYEGDQLERYRRLCPSWAFDEPPDDDAASLRLASESC